MKLKYDFYSPARTCVKGWFGWVVTIWFLADGKQIGWRFFGHQGFVQL